VVRTTFSAIFRNSYRRNTIDTSWIIAGWILELDRGEGIPWKGNYSSWLDQKSSRMALEEKVASKRRKT
jgi:hypothetical protein